MPPLRATGFVETGGGHRASQLDTRLTVRLYLPLTCKVHGFDRVRMLGGVDGH